MLSICIPAYNAAKFLPETLESVAAQTCSDWELVVVDDGSTDATISIVEEFSQRLRQPVRLIRHEENRGLPASRNSAYAAAKGDYIALLDSDDLWTPEHLEGLVRKADSRVVMVHSSSLLFQEHPQNVTMKREAPAGGTVLENLFAGDYIIQPSSVMLHRQVVERVGLVRGFDASGLGEDIDYWIRVARSPFPIEWNRAETCLYRKHATAMSGKSAILTEATGRVRLSHLDAPARSLAWRRRIAAGFLAAAGKMNFRNNPSRAAELYSQAWRLRPDYVQRLVFAFLAKIRSRP